MKKFILGIFLFIQAGLAYSQLNTTAISFDLRYPVPAGNNYLNKAFGAGYIGLIDIGVDYSIIKVNNWVFGILLNTSLLRLDKNDVTLNTISPKVKVDYKIDIGKLSLIPQVGFGYAA